MSIETNYKTYTKYCPYRLICSAAKNILPDRLSDPKKEKSSLKRDGFLRCHNHKGY